MPGTSRWLHETANKQKEEKNYVKTAQAIKGQRNKVADSPYNNDSTINLMFERSIWQVHANF
jgi:hypothetical protein